MGCLQLAFDWGMRDVTGVGAASAANAGEMFFDLCRARCQSDAIVAGGCSTKRRKTQKKKTRKVFRPCLSCPVQTDVTCIEAQSSHQGVATVPTSDMYVRRQRCYPRFQQTDRTVLERHRRSHSLPLEQPKSKTMFEDFGSVFFFDFP